MVKQNATNKYSRNKSKGGQLRWVLVIVTNLAKIGLRLKPIGVLEQLWPEYLGEVLARNLRGPFVMAHVIDDGLTLLKYSDNPEAEFPNAGPTISVETDLPIMGHGSTNQTRNSVTVRYPFTDDRFELIMSRKTKQLSKDEINLFAVDLPHVPAATKRWLPLARRRLQPNINRRFSAIILFFRYLDNNTGVFVQHCVIEQHPNPYRKLSESLLNDLSKLNTGPIS